MRVVATQIESEGDGGWNNLSAQLSHSKFRFHRNPNWKFID